MAEPALSGRLGGIFAIAAVVDNFSDRLLRNPKIVDANPELHEWHTVTCRTRIPGLKWARTSWLAASGLPLLCHALREPAATSQPVRCRHRPVPLPQRNELPAAFAMTDAAAPSLFLIAGQPTVNEAVT
jgi:hemoglobin